MPHCCRRNRIISRFLLVLLPGSSLCLPGCAAKPPDRGTISPAGLGDTNRMV